MLLIVLALVVYKLYSLEVISRSYLACHWCLSTKSLPYEVEFVLILLFLHFLSCISRIRVLRIAFRLLVIVFVVVTALDLVVSREFWVRLTMSEFLKFIFEPKEILNYLQQKMSSGWSAFMALQVLGTSSLVFGRYLLSNRSWAPPVILYMLIGVSLVGCQWMEIREYHDIFLRNSIQTFFSEQTSAVPYSQEFSTAILSRPAEAAVCSSEKGKKFDVVLVVFESLSMYHSALFSGVNDWMPEFDEISRNGVRYQNFYANGVTSEQGLIALLTGEPPVARGGFARTLFEQFRTPVQTVPNSLHDLGYHTMFLTTGDLGFMGKGQWLKDIGFDYAEGHDAPFYRGMKRYNFDAAADDALYARAYKELREPRARPLFMTLETVTTHLPNIDPDTGTHSQELTYRYADRQLGQFFRNLKGIGYFDHGMLIVTADHRAMVPMSTKERELYGDRAFVRVPMTIVGPGLHDRTELSSFSQTDLLPSLRNMLAQGEQCVGRDQGIFLPTAVHPPQCIFTNRSYSSNDVFVHCAGDDFTIELNGDKTHFVAGQFKRPELLNELHRLRLGKGFQ